MLYVVDFYFNVFEGGEHTHSFETFCVWKNEKSIYVLNIMVIFHPTKKMFQMLYTYTSNNVNLILKICFNELNGKVCFYTEKERSWVTEFIMMFLFPDHLRV